MKRSRQDGTTAKELELLDCYKTLSFLSQCEAAERLGIKSLQGLLKNEATSICAAEACGSGVKCKNEGKMRWKRLF